MCIKIRYTFLNCNHLSHIGRYTCYAAQQRGNGFDEKCENFKVTDQKVKYKRGQGCAVCTERGVKGTVVGSKTELEDELEFEGEIRVSKEEFREKNLEKVERVGDKEDGNTRKGSGDRNEKAQKKLQRKVGKKNRKAESKEPKTSLLAMFY